MARNRRFSIEYKVTIDGVTTNGAASRFLDSTLRALIGVLDNHYMQCSVKIKEVKSNAEKTTY